MSKNKYIDVYSTIYNIDIVVANKYVTAKDLSELYVYSDGVEIKDDDFNGNIACTMHCTNKETGKYCVLVKYINSSNIKTVDKKIDFLKTIVHEALHVVYGIYNGIGEKVYPENSNEATAYFFEYVFDCIYKTWTKK